MYVWINIILHDVEISYIFTVFMSPFSICPHSLYCNGTSISGLAEKAGKEEEGKHIASTGGHFRQEIITVFPSELYV